MAKAANFLNIEFNELMTTLDEFNNIPSYGLLITKLTRHIAQ